ETGCTEGPAAACVTRSRAALACAGSCCAPDSIGENKEHRTIARAIQAALVLTTRLTVCRFGIVCATNPYFLAAAAVTAAFAGDVAEGVVVKKVVTVQLPVT